MQPFSKRLLKWWDGHGRHDLPWQHPRSAYRCWVSEIMLQQTQVKTVIPYFEQFIARFPDVSSLAAASPDDVMSMWSGLGYYARARNLLKTAQVCVAEHGSELPTTPVELEALPGIGKSTANAIYSQAHDKPAVVLDGNVKRVLSRHLAFDGWPGKPAVHNQLWSVAETLLPNGRGADYTQAIMDLGATLCTRSKPQCGECPVAADCQALLQQKVAVYPHSRPKKIKVKEKTFQMLILVDDRNKVLLERRPPTGVWGGLWSLPANDGGEDLSERLPFNNKSLQPLPEIHHQLTHISMIIKPLLGSLQESHQGNSRDWPNGVECTADQQWFGADEWSGLGLPKPVRQLLEKHMTNKTGEIQQ
jgi:A/G-specific adenine glycosylase